MPLQKAAALLCAGAVLPSAVAPGAALAQAASEPPISAQADSTIVVTGLREPRGAVNDVVPERSVDAAGVSGYGAGTVREVLEEIAREEGGGEDPPVLFVNGVPIEDPEDIVDYPAEAVERIDVLPRGAGARAGGALGQRAYNVVLKRVFGSKTLVASAGLATEGGWSNRSGELLVTRIQDRKRLNVTLRAADDGLLLESDRGLLQPEPVFPFDILGNVVPDPRFGATEIDPVLSAAAGRLVTSVAVPAGTTRLTLADAVRGANTLNRTELGQYRTLRAASRAYEIGANYSQPVNGWLNLTANGRFDQTTFNSLAGLRAGLFILPAGNVASPFGQPVGLARYLPGDPLDQNSRQRRGSASVGLNGQRGKWQLGLRADYRFYGWTSEGERQARWPGNPILLDVLDDPFGAGLGTLLPLEIETSRSRTQTRTLSTNANGPLAELPAGPLRLGLTAELLRQRQTGRTRGPFFNSDRNFSRTELAGTTTLEVPITSREKQVLQALGDLSVSLRYSARDVGSQGTVQQHGYGAMWKPLPQLRLQASLDRQGSLPDPAQLGEPASSIDNVRYFDFLTGSTVDVTQITGGNPLLRSEIKRTRRLSGDVQLVKSMDLRLTAEHLLTRESNPIAQLPPASVELLLAFPDRFQRDPLGRLLTVDVRPVNFVSQELEQARWGLSFAVNLGRADRPAGASRGPRPRIQFDLAHTINIRSEVRVREDYPVIDLLQGGAVGYGGSLPRQSLAGGANFTHPLGGIRVTGTWRSSSVQATGAGAAASQLRLAPLAVLNLRTFVELGKVLPDQRWLKDGRLSINVANVFNGRQKVTDDLGSTPLRFQPAYRDPLGRVVTIELRKLL